jgi:acyl-CoA synthetase (NDP forming)
MDLAGIRDLIASVRAEDRLVFLESEGLALLRLMGLETPLSVIVQGEAELADWCDNALPGRRVVVKVQSPQILHKSDVGGVQVVANDREAIARAIAEMRDRLADADISNFTVNEFVEHDAGLGHEFLFGLRWTDDVGPVVTCGAGGIYSEFLAKNIRPGRDIAILSPALAGRDDVAAALREVAVVDLATGSRRGQPAQVAMEAMARTCQAFLDLAAALPDEFAEFEVNPFAVTPDGRLVALDALVRLRAPGPREVAPDKPLWKLSHLLEPHSAAIMGVSERMNPGHIIVNNLIREGFDRTRIYIVKPGSAAIEGCACVPDIASVPERVDLFVLCIDAAQAAGALSEIIESRKAESIVLIPGGLEEKAGSEQIVARMHGALADARRSDWRGPLINGGNCLGIRSLPGRYDTTFIPEYKLPVPSGPPSPVAFISQSGAFAVSKASKLVSLNPKYSVTLGNQMDLTVGDYLAYLQDDASIELFAVYVEGFRPLDGLKFLRAARDIVESGRTVILYRAGRTAAGAKASASHTASIAGDYAVVHALARHAGVMVADTLEDFEELTLLCAELRDVRVTGWRLGAVSNAGFECVAIADNLGSFSMGAFSPSSDRQLREIFARTRLDQVVDVHNPLDLTPMMADEAYAQVVETLLGDELLDAACVGCVPLTAALSTLAPSDGHAEDFRRDGSLVRRLAALRQASAKPWVAVVDAGALYDAMARDLAAHRIPTFRSADRALRIFNLFCDHRLRQAAGQVHASNTASAEGIAAGAR